MKLNSNLFLYRGNKLKFYEKMDKVIPDIKNVNIWDRMRIKLHVSLWIDVDNKLVNQLKNEINDQRH